MSLNQKATNMIEQLDATIGAESVRTIAATTTLMVQNIKEHMLAPENVKEAPILSQAEIITLANGTISRWQHFVKKHGPDMPPGVKSGGRVLYPLDQARALVKRLRKDVVEAKGGAVVIAVTNFKGGVTKTTTVATLAQGLSLRGLNCLVVDLDPQGSLTSLFGYLPDIDVEEQNTVMHLYYGHEILLDKAVVKTYWDGIDLIAASPELHSAEFVLPSRQRSDPSFRYWDVLNQGLESLKNKYDVILIDTPPSLSYTTANGIMAADALIMPLPPSPLDFASSAQFWGLCNDMMRQFSERSGEEKKFNFIDILLTRVDHNVGVSTQVREWILKSYGAMVLPVEIPKTSTADTAAASFGTVYDLQTNKGIARTLKRAKDSYDMFVNHVDKQIQGVWLSRSKEQ